MCKSNKIECPRCGGSGKTEHSHIVEGICFMCGGEGMVYPKRVGELTDKAKIRKANKDTKYQAELRASEERDNVYFGKVKAEITRRNKEFIANYKCATHKNAMKFYKTIKTFSKHLGFNSNTTEAEVRKMFKDFFKDQSFAYRIEISKYTLKYHNFCFVDVESDFQGIEHEVQNMLERYPK